MQVAFKCRIRNHGCVIGAERWISQLQFQSGSGNASVIFERSREFAADATAHSDQIHSGSLGRPNRLLHQDVDDGFLKRGAKVRLKITLQLAARDNEQRFSIR